MQFLSVDLEACNRYVHGSVFSIGVVLADEQFNVLHKEDIIINPKCKFVAKFRKPIEFSVTKEQAESAPTLAEQYDRIAELFSGDKIILAHSANNDMFMLNEACKRAHVPALQFDYICTQMIYSAIYDVMNGIGLDKAAEEMNLTFKHHKADDDAEMALYLLKSCCEHMGCDYLHLEKKLGIKRGRNANYQFVPMRSTKLEKLRKIHRAQKKEEQKELQLEYRSSHKIAIELDVKSYDSVRQGGGCVYVVNDSLVQQLEKGSIAYFVKQVGTMEVSKVEIENIKLWDSFLDLYLSGDPDSPVAHGESELDFLDRMYQVHDADKEKMFGVACISYHVVHNHN